MTAASSAITILCRGVVGVALIVPLLASAASARADAPPQVRPRISALPNEIEPPIVVVPQGGTDPVILKPGRLSTALSTLRIKRRIPIATLRSQPIITLGAAKVDMRPVFNNPKSPLVVAESLRAQPDLAVVLAQNVEVTEVDQGLIVHQYLSYRLKSGACTNRTARARVYRAGVSCMDRMTDQSRAAALADPGSPRYVANPARRQLALAASLAEVSAEQTKIAGDIKTLRAALADPAQHDVIEAIAGPGSVARLSAMSDEQLQAEMANTAKVEVEDAMFVPSVSRTWTPLGGLPAHKAPPKIKKTEDLVVDQPIANHVYVTGFTFGRGYEWRHRESVTVDWCVINCSSTYFAELYAGLGYGLGLRFPVRMGGVYHYQRQNGQESAELNAVFAPINGSEQDYTDAGLPGRELFGGRELVAELAAYAGMAYKVPFHSDNMRYEVGKDLTEDFSPPITQGQMTPPTPGPGGSIEKKVVLDSPDLLGGLADYGIAGARVLPAVDIGLVSDKLSFTLKDNVNGTSSEITQSGQSLPLAVNPADHSSSFSIGQPVYSLAFQVTPGIAARLFVDVSVWSHNWDFPVWFPQLAIKLPPDGVTFTCHASTICSRDYRYSATVANEAVGETMLPDDPIERQVELWRRDFRERWVPKCPHESPAICAPEIEAIIAEMGPEMIEDMRKNMWPPTSMADHFYQLSGIAEQKGQIVIRDAKVRNIRSYGEGLIKLHEPVWKKDCADQPCRDRIHAIGMEYVQALADGQNAEPEAPRDVILGQVNINDYAARARQEVTASILRNKTRVRTFRPLPAQTPPRPVGQ